MMNFTCICYYNKNADFPFVNITNLFLQCMEKCWSQWSGFRFNYNTDISYAKVEVIVCATTGSYAGGDA